MKVAPPSKRSRVTNDYPVASRGSSQSRLRLTASLPELGNYTVIDNGCDMAYLGRGWKVVRVHKRYARDHHGNLKQIVDCAATIMSVTDGHKRQYRVRVCNALYYPERRESLLPPDQIRWNKGIVNDTAIIHGGEQNIIVDSKEIELLHDGKTFFFIHTGLRKSKRDNKLPFMDLTSPKPYDPRKLASKALKEANEEPVPIDIEFVDTNDPLEPTKLASRRNYVWDATSHLWNADQLTMWKKRLVAPTDEVVKKTFLATTQLVPSVRHENEHLPKDYHVQRFPMLFNRRIKETLYCDIVEWKVMKTKYYAFLCYTSKSKTLAIYPMGKRPTSNKALEALTSFTRDFGIPCTIKSDYANSLSKSVAWKRFARVMQTELKESEANKHNQNHVERAWQDLERKGQFIEQTCMVPQSKKFSMYKHLCDVHNHTALNSIGWKTPMEIIDGETPDISPFRFYFWEPVWYLEGSARQPERNWVKGRFEGMAWTTGDQMCYIICPDQEDMMKRTVARSIVLSRHPDEKAPHEINHKPSDYYFPTPVKLPLSSAAGRKRPAPAQDASDSEESLVPSDQETDEFQPKPGEASENDTVSTHPETDDEAIDPPPDTDCDPSVQPGELGPVEQELRKDYLRMAEENQQRYIELTTPPPDILDHGDVVRIIGHRTYARNGQKTYKFNIEMSLGKDMKAISLEDMKVDCPAMTAKYIMQHRTLSKEPELTSWAKPIIKSYDKIVRIAKQMERRYGITIITLKESHVAPMSRPLRIKCRRRAMTNSKYKLKSNSPNKRKSNAMGTFKYGVYVPKNTEDALLQDKRNGNSLWRDAIIREVTALQEMGTFRPLLKKECAEIVKTHQYAPLRFIYDMKEDLRRKCRVVIGGHVIDSGDRDTYSSNMKSVSARLLMLIAGATDMEVLTGDIGNAYLYAKTDLDVYVRLGEEFNIANDKYKPGELATVEQALYGLSTSARLWRSELADTLRTMDFVSGREDCDVWTRKTDYGYEYIGTHTDDLMIVSRNPRAIMEALQAKYTIKKIGEPVFHLGLDYRRTADGMWEFGTKTHVHEAIKKVSSIMQTTLRKIGTPHSDSYKPELDDTPLLETQDHRRFQQLIGMAQWLITCGRMDIGFAVNSLSRFSASPREGHLEAATRIFAYLSSYPEKWVPLDPGEHKPNGTLEDPCKGIKPDWKDYYFDAYEEIDSKYPEPEWTDYEGITTTVYFDSNHAHDEVTRRSVTGTITYVGNCPVGWMSKRQGAIATGTYGAELCAARQGTEEAIAIRCLIRSFGIPLKGKTLLLGDNLGSLISVSTPGSPCKKKHVSIAYHYVRECNAAGIIDVKKVHTDHNLADSFTKALAKNKHWSTFTAIFARRNWKLGAPAKRATKGKPKRKRPGKSRLTGRTTKRSTKIGN